MTGCRPEHRHKCSWQRSLPWTCLTFICCLMRLNARLIEFTSIQTLLGPGASGDTVTTVFMDSPALQFVLNYLCSTLQQRGGRLQTVPGMGLVFSVEEVIAGISHDTEVKTVTQSFQGCFEGSRLLAFCPASLILLLWFLFSLEVFQRKTISGNNVNFDSC